MKRVYLTEEAKQEIEAKIAELENEVVSEFSPGRRIFIDAQLKAYKEILQSATILPVEESWQNIAHSTTVSFYEFDFPQGVIIQSK